MRTGLTNCGCDQWCKSGSIGATYRDPNFVANINGARNNGLRVGLYHLFRMTSSAEEQMTNIRQAMGMVRFHRAMDLFAVQIEAGTDAGLTAANRKEISDKLFSLLEQLRAKLQIRPLILANANSINTLLDVDYKKFSNYNLWIAQFRGISPDLPRPWSGWMLHQFDNQGKISGIRGNVHLNRAGVAF